MKNKVLTMILGACIALSLTACGGKAATGSSDTVKESSSVAESSGITSEKESSEIASGSGNDAAASETESENSETTSENGNSEASSGNGNSGTTSENGNSESTSESGTAHTHSYTEKVTKEPSCEKDGEKTFTCTCGDSYTEKIAAAGSHEFGEYVYDYEAKGYAESAVCKKCGEKDTRKLSYEQFLERLPRLKEECIELGTDEFVLADPGAVWNNIECPSEDFVFNTPITRWWYDGLGHKCLVHGYHVLTTEKSQPLNISYEEERALGNVYFETTVFLYGPERNSEAVWFRMQDLLKERLE